VLVAGFVVFAASPAHCWLQVPAVESCPEWQGRPVCFPVLCVAGALAQAA